MCVHLLHAHRMHPLLLHITSSRSPTSCSRKMLSNIRVQTAASSVARAARTFSQFKKVGVVGLGLMGHGVAQVTAAAGYQVLAIEAKPEALAVGMKRCVLLF